MALLDLIRDRRRTIEPDLETSALAGKHQHETLFGSYARSALNWRRFAFLVVLVVLWDRYELAYVVNEKRYVPVPILEHPDGSLHFLGTPDPNWKPQDRTVIDELQWYVQAFRGRTTDAKFDLKLWQRALDHSTDTGMAMLAQAFEDKEKLPHKGRIEIVWVSLNKLSEQTFDLRWQERRYDVPGELKKTLSFRGLLQVMIDVPTRDYAALAKNVSGVWVDGWSISPEGN